MSASPERIVASEIREILDRYRDVFAPAPAFIREAILARLDARRASEISQFAERVAHDLRIRGGLVPMPGCLCRDPATAKVMRGHSDSVAHVVSLGDGRALSASDDETLRLWDLATGATLRVLEGHSSAVRDVVSSRVKVLGF